jgi:hypothetical protein
MLLGDDGLKVRPWILATLITGTFEVPFVLMAMQGPHSEYGGFGIAFFMPAIGLLTMLFFDSPHFETSTAVFITGVLLVQTFLLVPVFFWILTRKRRSAAKTALRVVTMLSFLFLVSLFFARFESAQATAQIETGKASHFAMVSSLRTLNAALSKYRETYGQYPDNLKQLGPPSRVAAPSPDRAALVTDPLDAESYFILSYQVDRVENGKRTGYEIHGTPRSQKYSYLSQYFTDQTGLIRADSRRATAKSLVITEDLRPTVTIR